MDKDKELLQLKFKNIMPLVQGVSEEEEEDEDM